MSSPIRAAGVILLACLARFSQAHGAASFPAARQWICSGGPTPNLGVGWNGANGPTICSPAVHTGNINTVITEWSGVAQGAAAGWSTSDLYKQSPRAPHVKIMGGLDASVCSAGLSKFSALDDPIWTIPQESNSIYPTHITTGKHKFQWSSSAPHKTAPSGYIDVYITKNGWDSSAPVTWNQLEETPFCHYVPDGSGFKKLEEYDCVIPEGKQGTHVIFEAWQRTEQQSSEAFYSCSDVVIDGEESPSTEMSPTTEMVPTTEVHVTTEESAVTTESVSTNMPIETTEAVITTTESTTTVSPCVQPATLSLLDSNARIIPRGDAPAQCLELFDDTLRASTFCNDARSQFSIYLTSQLQAADGRCWQVDQVDAMYADLQVSLQPCNAHFMKQMFKYDATTGTLRMLAGNDDFCVGYDSSGVVSMLPCVGLGDASDRVMSFGV